MAFDEGAGIPQAPPKMMAAVELPLVHRLWSGVAEDQDEDDEQREGPGHGDGVDRSHQRPPHGRGIPLRG